MTEAHAQRDAHARPPLATSAETWPYAPPYQHPALLSGQQRPPDHAQPHGDHPQDPAPPWEGAHAAWPGHPAPHGPPVEKASGPHPAAVAALALGCAAIAVLGVAAGLVSAAAGLAGLLTGVAALLVRRRPRGTRGLAAAGVTTSGVAVVIAGVVFLLSGTGVGANLQSWLGGEVDFPIVGLRVGEPGTVGDYTVTVDEIRMAADAALGADPRNSPAEGRYVEAVVTVTYLGDDVGVVEDDLLVSYVGSEDDWIYDEWGCAAVTESPVWEVEPLAPGSSARFVACMDVPADVVDEAAVIVEDLAARHFTAEMWGER